MAWVRSIQFFPHFLTKSLDEAITGDGIYKMLKACAAAAGMTIHGLFLHALRRRMPRRTKVILLT